MTGQNDEPTRLEDAIIKQYAPLRKPAEPAPIPPDDPLAVHEQRLTTLVSGVNLQAINEWTKFRGETDEVMRTLREREQQILDLIAKLIQDARSSGAAVAIFSENLTRLRDEFRVQLPKAATLKPNGSDSA